jgi:hypothetical protein
VKSVVGHNRSQTLERGDRVDVHGGAEEDFFGLGRRRKVAAPRAHLVLRHEPTALDHHRFIVVLEASLDLSQVHVLRRALGEAVDAVAVSELDALATEAFVKRSIAPDAILLPFADPTHERQVIPSLFVR